MKLLTVLFIMTILAGGLVAAQAPDYTQLLKRLELSEEDTEWFLEFQTGIDNKKREAQIELNIVKAQLEKLLFPVDVDMREVEKLMRTSIEWRLQLELAEIRWRVEVRRKLGEETYTKLLRIIQTARLATQKNASPARQEKE